MSDAGTPGPPPPPPPPPRTGRSAPPPPPPPSAAATTSPSLPTAPKTAPAGARKGASNAVIGIIAAVALVVVGGLGIGIGSFVLNQSDSGSPSSQGVKDDSPTQADESDEDVDDEDSTSTPTPAESADVPAADTSPAVVFQSASGNIVCSMTKQSVVCHQNNIKYSPPSSACATALGGATVGVDRRSAFWPCLDSALPAGQIVAYDVPLLAYDFSCSINYVSGVTCSNEEGAGFTMEYTNGIQTF